MAGIEGAEGEQTVVDYYDFEKLQKVKITREGDSFIFTRNKDEEILPEESDVQIIRLDIIEGTFVEAAEINNREILVPIDMVDPNPSQPRSYYPADTMRELQAQLIRTGQLDAASGRLYRTPKGELRFVIIEGERRYQGLRNIGQKFILIKPRPITDEATMRLDSIMQNETKQAHNPIEQGRSFRELVECYRKGKGLTDEDKEEFEIPKWQQAISLDENTAIDMLAWKLTRAKKGSADRQSKINKIKNRIKLLDLPKDIQRQIAIGTITMSALSQIQKAARGFEDRSSALASIAKKALEISERSGAAHGQLAPTAIMTAIQMVQRGGDEIKISEKQRVEQAITKASGAIERAIGALSDVVGQTAGITKEVLRERASRLRPTEGLVEGMDRLSKLMENFRNDCMSAIEPDYIDIPKGFPKFVAHIKEKIRKRTTPIFSNDKKINEFREKIALAIAETSDQDGSVIFFDDLCKKVGASNQNEVSNNLRHMGKELASIGLELLTWPMRKRSDGGKGSLEQYMTYRFKYIKGAQVNENEETSQDIPQDTPSDEIITHDEDHELPESPPQKGSNLIQWVEKYQWVFKNDTRYKMARCIARASISKSKGINITEIAEDLKKPEEELNAQINTLKEELNTIFLNLYITGKDAEGDIYALGITGDRIVTTEPEPETKAISDEGSGREKLQHTDEGRSDEHQRKNGPLHFKQRFETPELTEKDLFELSKIPINEIIKIYIDLIEGKTMKKVLTALSDIAESEANKVNLEKLMECAPKIDKDPKAIRTAILDVLTAIENFLPHIGLKLRIKVEEGKLYDPDYWIEKDPLEELIPDEVPANLGETEPAESESEPSQTEEQNDSSENEEKGDDKQEPEIKKKKKKHRHSARSEEPETPHEYTVAEIMSAAEVFTVMDKANSNKESAWQKGGWTAIVYRTNTKIYEAARKYWESRDDVTIERVYQEDKKPNLVILYNDAGKKVITDIPMHLLKQAQ